MQPKKARTLKHGQVVWVRGTIRNNENNASGKWVEVQFPTYSLDIPARDVRLPRKRKYV